SDLDVERHGVIQAGEVALRIQGRQVGEHPPPVFICGHVPDLVHLTKHHLALHALYVLYDLVPRLALSVTANVLFGARVALDAVSAQFTSGHWMRVHRAIRWFVAGFILTRCHESLPKRPNARVKPRRAVERSTWQALSAMWFA